jgi:hypothetical protein
MGPNGVYGAKVFHDLQSPCPFPCRFHQLLKAEDEEWVPALHAPPREATCAFLQAVDPLKKTTGVLPQLLVLPGCEGKGHAR